MDSETFEDIYIWTVFRNKRGFPSWLSPSCFKASPNAKPSIWKLIYLHTNYGLFTCE